MLRLSGAGGVAARCCSCPNFAQMAPQRNRAQRLHSGGPSNLNTSETRDT